MTYEEKLALAEQLRNSKRNGPVSEEELKEYPAEETEFWLEQTAEKKIHIYRIAPPNLPEHAPMIINFHGGGFIKERNARDRLFCSRLALRFQCLIWDVDYSLAPEHPYPTAVEESYFVVSYAFSHWKELGINPHKVMLTGHSAGGNLASTVCMRASEEQSFQPAGLFIEYAPLDLYTDPAEKPSSEKDVPSERAKMYNSLYCEQEQAKAPYASPIFATEEQLQHFPPTMIFSCGLDRLRWEDEEFALKLVRSGVPVTARRFRESVHGFVINRMAEWEQGLEMLMEFVEKTLR